ncbi:MAG: hypothetical protein HZA46_16295 [Planctomycetales bacterium]|nr:hypothetical protein [Planctomycetales bacterium]
MSDLSSLRHRAVSCLGTLAAAVRYNRVDRVQRDEGTWYCRKQRRWLTAPLIWAGNQWLARQGAGVQILSFAEWTRREEQFFAVLYKLTPLVEQDVLWLPALPGERLDDWLTTAGPSQLDRMLAVSSACKALGELHQIQPATPSGQFGLASHGDATVGNVLFEPSTGRATWCDFEMQHDVDRPAAWRHADDLRALLCSAAVRCADAELPLLVQTVVASYPHAGIVSNLRDALDREIQRPCSYHAAQANLDQRRLVILRDLVAVET